MRASVSLCVRAGLSGEEYGTPVSVRALHGGWMGLGGAICEDRLLCWKGYRCVLLGSRGSFP